MMDEAKPAEVKIEIKFKFGTDDVHTEIWTYDARDYEGDIKNWSEDDWEQALFETEPEFISAKVLED